MFCRSPILDFRRRPPDFIVYLRYSSEIVARYPHNYFFCEISSSHYLRRLFASLTYGKCKKFHFYWKSFSILNEKFSRKWGKKTFNLAKIFDEICHFCEFRSTKISLETLLINSLSVSNGNISDKNLGVFDEKLLGIHGDFTENLESLMISSGFPVKRWGSLIRYASDEVGSPIVLK